MDSVDVDKIEALRSEIARFCKIMHDSGMIVVKAQFIAQRFGKRIRAVCGLNVTEFLEADPRYYKSISDRGCYLVALKPDAVQPVVGAD